jgi:dTDP-D-glucose 4,6-dehydratase
MSIHDGTEPIKFDKEGVMAQPRPDDQLLVALLDLWQKMIESKPNDRSEKDRRYAVAITKLQDTIAWFKAMVIDEFKPLV